MCVEWEKDFMAFYKYIDGIGHPVKNILQQTQNKLLRNIIKNTERCERAKCGK